MLPVTNSRGKFISVLDLEGQFEWIKADAKHADGKKSLKGQMNQKNYIFSFVALPSPNTKKNHPK